VAEARRVARELLVVDASREHATGDEERHERILNDGSRRSVSKRCLRPDRLLVELGGGDTLYAGRWFVAIRSPRA
jgi:hypothetical protein